VPTNDSSRVRAVRPIFDLYTKVGLSRRQISARLNREGIKFNGGAFGHTDVTHILENPAYAGATHFDKTQTCKFKTFDAGGLVVGAERRAVKYRDAEERHVRWDTHEALVDRRTWEVAQQKLAGERERTNFSPRNPAYYLKQLFVCGHCGKNLTGRTEIDPDTRQRRVVYVCASYIAGRCNGHKTECGYHRITHADGRIPVSPSRAVALAGTPPSRFAVGLRRQQANKPVA